MGVRDALLLHTPPCLQMSEHIFRYSQAMEFPSLLEREPPSHRVFDGSLLHILGPGEDCRVVSPSQGSASQLSHAVLAAGVLGSFEKSPELFEVQRRWASLGCD